MDKKEIQNVAQEIRNAQSIVLTTHKNCDADGLGSVLALHDALKSLGKQVQSLCIEEVPQRYSFMKYQDRVEIYPHKELKKADLVLIFDTNDPQYIEPLYSDLIKKTQKQIFIDHHSPVQGSKSLNLLIDKNASSTGEICYLLLEEMGIPITKEIARSLYISIIFDTHMFQSSKNLSQAFYACSKLCHHADINDIYSELFCQYSQKNLQEMVALLNQVQYKKNIAFIECSFKEFKKTSLKVFHILDVLDWIMKVESVAVGFMSIEKNPQSYKLSFRSKKGIDVAVIAEALGGGGHTRSAGATIDHYSSEKILDLIEKHT